MSETLRGEIGKKIAQLDDAILALTQLSEQIESESDLEKSYKKLLDINPEIYPRIVTMLKEKLYGEESIREMVEGSKATWYWSAQLGKYLDNTSGESLQEKTGVIFPPYYGTISAWNEGLVELVRSRINHGESAQLYVHPFAVGYLMNTMTNDYKIIESFALEEDSVLISITDGSCEIIKIKDIV